jgi:UDP-glucuronate 4-epimerase
LSGPRRILVTGAAGFIGSTLVDRLVAEGRQVIGLDCFDPFYAEAEKRRNLAESVRASGFELIEGDIRDAEALARALAGRDVEAAVHLAALAGVRPSLERPTAYADVNVRGTASVFEACLRHGVPRVVFASSSSVYGERGDGLPFREDDPADRPISPYAATKRAGEILARGFHEAFGLEITCARIFTAYGERQRPDLAIRKFAERMLRGEPVPVFGDGTSRRDFTYVGDLVDGLVRALDRATGFEVVNFGAGKTVTVLEMVQALENALGVQARIDWQPRQSGDVSRTWADVGHARTRLGYAPQVPFDAGIERFAAWLRSVRP